MIQADFHCHTTFVDGAHSAEEMVLSAIEKGMKTLGISEHAHVPFDPECSLSLKDTLAYRQEIARLKEKYKDQITLLCGIEMDYYAQDDPTAYDYVIGSVHYLNVNGNTYCVDLSPKETLRCIDEAFLGDYYAYAKCYFEHVAELKNKWNPNIIGHFDLLTKFQEKGVAFDLDHPIYNKAAEHALKALAGCTFEVNTGAISRGYRNEPYPAFPYLKSLRENGNLVLLSSDSHHKDTLLYQFNLAKELVHAAGFVTAGFVDGNGTEHIQF